MSSTQEPGWPGDHSIGVYLSVGGVHTLVATARGRGDVSRLFRGLADSWDALQDSRAESDLVLAGIARSE